MRRGLVQLLRDLAGDAWLVYERVRDGRELPSTLVFHNRAREMSDALGQVEALPMLVALAMASDGGEELREALWTSDDANPWVAAEEAGLLVPWDEAGQERPLLTKAGCEFLLAGVRGL